MSQTKHTVKTKYWHRVLGIVCGHWGLDCPSVDTAYSVASPDEFLSFSNMHLGFLHMLCCLEREVQCTHCGPADCA